MNTRKMLKDRGRDQALQLVGCGARKGGYGKIRTETLPRYLQHGKEIKLVARFRLENEERGCQNWRKIQTCRICNVGPETIEHLLNCCGISGWTRVSLLNETGKGDAVMKIIIMRRKEAEERRRIKL